MTFLLWLGIVFVGAVLALLLWQDVRVLRGSRRRTQGTVIGHHVSSDEGSQSYSPRIRFTTEDGRQIEFVDYVGSAQKREAVGATLAVVYPVRAPELARVPHPLLRTTIYAVVLGMLLLLVLRKLDVIH